MRQGRIHGIAVVALSGVLLAAVAGSSVAGGNAAARPRIAGTAQGAKQAGAPSRAKRAANTLRQFTGYVSAIDKTSITVEKRGKVPETRVFAKHEELRTTGDVEKDARVTVYYREEGGQSIAHRVVVKPARSSPKSRS